MSPVRVRPSALAAPLGLPLEPRGGVAEQEVAHLALDRPPEEHPEHSAGVDLQAVGGPRPARAEVLEVPPAAHRLGVALLLHPLDAVRLVVGEAQPGLDVLDLGVGLGLDHLGPALVVVLEHAHLLQRALPLRRALDVGIDLDGAVSGDQPHWRATLSSEPMSYFNAVRLYSALELCVFTALVVTAISGSSESAERALG